MKTVKLKKAERAYHNYFRVGNVGAGAAIAQGPNSRAVAANGVMFDGNVSGNIIAEDGNQVTSYGGDRIEMSGDFGESFINLKSTLTDVSQKIENQRGRSNILKNEDDLL